MQIEECGILESRVADQVIELVSSFNYVHVADELDAHHVFFLENADVSVNVQVLQVLLPVVVAHFFDDCAEGLLKRGTAVFDCCLDDQLVVLGEDFVLLENHRPRPATVVNRKVQNPLMSYVSAHLSQKPL